MTFSIQFAVRVLRCVVPRACAERVRSNSAQLHSASASRPSEARLLQAAPRQEYAGISHRLTSTLNPATTTCISVRSA